MKKRLKGLLSLWLAVVMLFGMLPVLSTPAGGICIAKRL